MFQVSALFLLTHESKFIIMNTNSKNEYYFTGIDPIDDERRADRKI